MTAEKNLELKRDEIVANVAEKLGMTRADVFNVISETLNEIEAGLAAGKSVNFPSFMTFTLVERKERVGRNPRTGEAVAVPRRSVVRVIPRKRLYELRKEI